LYLSLTLRKLGQSQPVGGKLRLIQDGASFEAALARYRRVIIVPYIAALFGWITVRWSYFQHRLSPFTRRKPIRGWPKFKA
jgi:hypothetical protein